jgi:hypothetical protein
MIRRVVGCAASHRLALQQHGQERLRCGCLPHHDECFLAIVPDPRFALRPAHQRRDHGNRGRIRGLRLGKCRFQSLGRH